MNWTKLLSQGHGVTNSEKDKMSNNWTEYSRGIPPRKLTTAQQLRANIYPTREFLPKGRQESQNKSCQHCQVENETCAHIIGYFPTVQDVRIKRHNQLCKILVQEAKKKDWIVFQEPLLTDEQHELYKPDLVFVKGHKALVVDITITCESKPTPLEDVAADKVTPS